MKLTPEIPGTAEAKKGNPALEAHMRCTRLLACLLICVPALADCPSDCQGLKTVLAARKDDFVSIRGEEIKSRKSGGRSRWKTTIAPEGFSCNITSEYEKSGPFVWRCRAKAPNEAAARVRFDAIVSSLKEAIDRDWATWEEKGVDTEIYKMFSKVEAGPSRGYPAAEAWLDQTKNVIGDGYDFGVTILVRSIGK